MGSNEVNHVADFEVVSNSRVQERSVHFALFSKEIGIVVGIFCRQEMTA